MDPAMANNTPIRIAYRLQPWTFVDRLVRDSCPPGFEIVEIGREATLEQRQAALSSAEYLMGSWVTSAQTLTEDDFKAGPSLKLVQLMSSGYDFIDLGLAARYGVRVSHFGPAMATAVAEQALLLMLMVYRRAAQQHMAVKEGRWRGLNPDLYELRGKRVGIVGLGQIGREIAKRVRAFDAEVMYCGRRQLTASEEQALGLTFTAFEDLLRQADIVCLSASLTSRTRHLIGTAQLALMKPSAVLINVGRGALVDQPALVDALSSGRLLGAGLDTLEQEPPAADDPLLALDNVALSPHTAGVTVEAWPRVVQICFENIQRVTRGEPPLYPALPLN